MTVRVKMNESIPAPKEKPKYNKLPLNLMNNRLKLSLTKYKRMRFNENYIWNNSKKRRSGYNTSEGVRMGNITLNSTIFHTNY